MVTRAIRAARVTSRSSKKAERQAPRREQQSGPQPTCRVGNQWPPGIPLAHPYRCASPPAGLGAGRPPWRRGLLSLP